ncbi:hypothetical protein JIN84_13650 [Luteolibacter yonseiensis]|uniref:Entericidin n=1 Tax=Luteolibacter yonseiensis TaxID=1144680 RepID=A0A934VC05_9BACT|nr:hypothetical protein [Luteolibacter yonseiensis]MBK1816665.1 hypothetical protein [Luteolibacter yonseiensis]
MKRTLQTLSLAALLLSLNSCGLPGALARSAGRVVEGVGNVANQAMTTGL